MTGTLQGVLPFGVQILALHNTFEAVLYQLNGDIWNKSPCIVKSKIEEGLVPPI